MTHLSRRLTAGAFFPSTYSVFGLPGNSRTTPSKEVPMLGADTMTLFAKDKRLKPSRGKMFKRRSRASLECLVVIPEAPLPSSSSSSGVKGGVGRSHADWGFPGIFLGATAEAKPEAVTRFLVFSMEAGRNGERGIGGIIDARLSVTQSDDPRSGGHFCLGMSKPPLVYNETRRANKMKECLTPGPPENVVE